MEWLIDQVGSEIGKLVILQKLIEYNSVILSLELSSPIYNRCINLEIGGMMLCV